jgi:hypothetical protein
MIRLEDKIQGECVLWFHNTYPTLRGALHCNNNNSHNQAKGSNMKAMGVFEGVADLELLCPNGRTLYIEVKTHTGTQSPAQMRWMQLCFSLGHQYIIVRSKKDFIEHIIEIYPL